MCFFLKFLKFEKSIPEWWIKKSKSAYKRGFEVTMTKTYPKTRFITRFISLSTWFHYGFHLSRRASLKTEISNKGQQNWRKPSKLPLWTLLLCLGFSHKQDTAPIYIRVFWTFLSCFEPNTKNASETRVFLKNRILSSLLSRLLHTQSRFPSISEKAIRNLQ